MRPKTNIINYMKYVLKPFVRQATSIFHAICTKIFVFGRRFLSSYQCFTVNSFGFHDLTDDREFFYFSIQLC